MRYRRAIFLATSLLLGAFCMAGQAQGDVRIFEQNDEAGERTFDLYGWVQPRFTVQQNDVRPPYVDFEPNPAFTVRRARFGGIAWMNGWIKAQFELEAAAPSVNALDAYVFASPIPEIGLTVGQFRVPFSRQNLLPSKN